MATSYSNFDAAGSVRIEIEGANEGHSYGTDLARALQYIAATVTGTIGKIPAEQRPQEVSLSCGLKALHNGFAISHGTGVANFTLSLVWRSESTQGLPGASLMPSETEQGT